MSLPTDNALRPRDQLIYCLQGNGVPVVLRNRDYMPVNNRSRTPDATAAATYYCRISDALKNYCMNRSPGELYFFQGTPPEIGTTEHTDLLQRISVFMSSGLYDNSESYIESFEGSVIEKIRRDSLRMLTIEEYDAIDSIMDFANTNDVCPQTFHVRFDQLDFEFEQSLESITSYTRDPRFKAACEHVGLSICISGKSTFAVKIKDVYGPELERLRKLDDNF